ncbi:hypothetical protein ACP70R_020543 [Stipagrostis hirtigluma subsp. patula]
MNNGEGLIPEIISKQWQDNWMCVAFTVVIAVVWPALSLPVGRFSLGYFTFWAVLAIAWGTVASAVIIVMPLVESWGTICKVCVGIFTNDTVTSTWKK